MAKATRSAGAPGGETEEHAGHLCPCAECAALWAEAGELIAQLRTRLEAAFAAGQLPGTNVVALPKRPS